jgi:hypothetical protein
MEASPIDDANRAVGCYRVALVATAMEASPIDDANRS